MSVPRPRIFLAAAASLLVLGSAAGWLAARHFLPPLLAAWVAGPAFHQMITQAVNTALKVDGTFGPLTLGEELSVTTSGFTSRGWPGQAIGALDTGTATGRFDPWGVFRGQWRVDLITIASADFRLINPDDSLKARDPVSPPKPWTAALLPTQFFCRWIECPDMSIELPLGQSTVRGSGLHVGAMMVGRNFKYFGRHGTLHYPGYPDLAVDDLEVYVTREMIDIGYLYLREPSSPQSNLQLAARLGQQADKSIQASATITSLGLSPFLPAEIGRILSARLNGHLTYATDTTGGGATGEGSLSLDGAVLSQWDYLDRLARRSGDPALAELRLSEVSLDYALQDDLITVSRLAVTGVDQIAVSGRGSWHLKTGAATASVTAQRLPLGAYLPVSLAGGLTGELGGAADWTWRGTDLGNGRGGGNLEVTGAQIDGFKFQQFLDRFLKTDRYARITVSRATATWRQDDDGIHLDNLDVLAPGQAGLRGSARVSPDGSLSGTVLAGLPASSLAWLPEATGTVFAQAADDLHWCVIELSGTVEKPRNNFTAQVMRQLGKHPLAFADLAVRGLSWWLGDALGTAPHD